MRRKLLPLLTVALCLFLNGCGEIMSLFQLYTKGMGVADDTLVGRWEGIDKPVNGKEKTECCWVFAKEGDGYSLSIPNADDKQVWRSTTHLIRFGDATIMDMEPAKPSYSHTTEVGFPMLDVHMIARVWIEKDTVRIALVDQDGFKAALVRGQTRLPFISKSDDILLTATTEQLQAFFTEHANDMDLFTTEPFSLRRKR